MVEERLPDLRASSCLAVKQGKDELDVHLLNSVSERHDRATLSAFAGAWQAGNSEAPVEIVLG